MIYSNQFVWLHFPKCAGTKIENIFKQYYMNVKTIHQDIVDPRVDPKATWHDSIADREKRDSNFILGDKTVICSFRRLPSWLESRYSYEVYRNPQLNHQAELLLEGKFLEHRGFLNHADYYVKKYIPESFLRSGKIKFIRTEYFEDDFKSAFDEFIDLSLIHPREFLKKVNTSHSAVPAGIKEKLLQEQEQLYKKCPYWKMIEDIAYG